MGTTDQSQHEEPRPEDVAGARDDLDAPLNLQPAGDTGDLVASDVISVMAVLLNDGSECFILITTKGIRHAPVSSHNSRVLSSLVTIRDLRAAANEGGDVAFSDFLQLSNSEGNVKEASLFNGQTGTQWLVVQVGADVEAFACTDDRYQALADHGFLIHQKTKKNLTNRLTI